MIIGSIFSPLAFTGALKPKATLASISPGANAAGTAAGVVSLALEKSCNVDGKIVPKVFIISMVNLTRF